MKITIAIIFSLIIIWLSFFRKENKKDKLRVFNILETTVVGDSTTRLENDSSGFNVVYYKDFEIYEYPIIRLVADTPEITDGIYTFVSRESKDTIFNYYVSKIGGEKVLMYESINSKALPIITRDSLLKLFNIDSLNLEYLDLDLERTHKKTSFKKTNNIKAEYFIDDHPKDETYADTIIRYYDTKFKDINFSYSPRLDKENDSKLVLTRFITLPRKVIRKNGKEEITPYLEDSAIIRKTKTKRSAIYMALIKRYEKDREKLNLK